MRSPPRHGWRGPAAALALAALATLASSCGSGITAGIEGTGAKVASVSAGTISRFGSIFVNGVEYDTTTAAVSIDGQGAAAGDLRVGQVVLVQGSIDPNGTTGKAAQVEFDTNVQGPVAAANAAASTLTVLGQTVRISPQTSLAADAGGTPNFASFAAGAQVSVSGFVNANGDISATRVQLRSQVADYLIAGAVSSVNAPAYQFLINGARIDFSGATLIGFPGARSVQPGDVVQIATASGRSTGTLFATRVTLLAGASGGSGTRGDIDGDVTRFASTTDFDVDGTRVTTNAQTLFQNGSASQLAAGVEISVQGDFDATGTLVAGSVQFARSAPILVKGSVDAVDPSTNTLTVLGISVATSATTRFEDQSAAPVSPFNLGAVAVGDFVEIHGSLTSANAVAASLLTREEPGGETELRGQATSVAAPSLTLLGVSALTGANTRFSNSAETTITSAQFFAGAAAGATVDLQGVFVGGVLQVTAAVLPSAADLGE